MIRHQVFFMLFAAIFAVISYAGESTELRAIRLAGNIPKAVHDANDGRKLALCDGEGRTPSGGEDNALTAAGWIPFFASQHISSTTVSVAATSLDSSCKPKGLAVFVFLNGKAVGTITSQDSDAVPTLRLNDATTLIVTFDFRRPTDPHCCPTGKASINVNISDKGIVAK